MFLWVGKINSLKKLFLGHYFFEGAIFFTERAGGGGVKWLKRIHFKVRSDICAKKYSM